MPRLSRSPFAEFIREFMGPRVYDEADRLFGLFEAQTGAPARPRRVRAVKPAWPYRLFGLAPSASRDEYLARYRELAMDAHPDRPGGSHRRMSRVNQAWDIIRAERGWT